MGSYSELYLGEYLFAWKYDVPSFMTLFFKEDMFYKEESPDGDSGDIILKEVGYKCTINDSKKILDDYGYDFQAIVKLYQFFYVRWIEDVKYDIFEVFVSDHEDKTSIEQQLEFKRYLAAYPNLSYEEELRYFIEVFRDVLNEMHKELLDDIDLRFKSVDFDALELFIHGKELRYPPFVVLIFRLFDWFILEEYSEILAMLYFRVFLEIVPGNSIFKLDLHDIIEEEEHVKDLHSELAIRLIDKISLYNNFFNPLLAKEDFIKEKYIKLKGIELLTNCLREESSYKKGLQLEELTELIFTSNKSLEISSSRVETGDEEIDIVIMNKLETAFWRSFGSMIFVECKNWNTPIGAKEMRDFETKLRNHQNITSLGIFVSINGFTKESINHLRRIGREKYHIVIIDQDHINEYLHSKMSLFEWLEKQVKIIY
ncbi:restriction endonuclease [uncultured Algoriphagus sp.]|uniref:restriction endonuclease n=1 Tax=uncultured Algoriphagus sp. TaxID=417365 RepID=UPI0030EE41D9|tara:strand:- start:1172 stop:2455 length:1284 start_codon:yes stop_codon:yes gene_type:complete